VCASGLKATRFGGEETVGNPQIMAVFFREGAKINTSGKVIRARIFPEGN
jgi:hypothetical protein